jgi:hypothetical protein
MRAEGTISSLMRAEGMRAEGILTCEGMVRAEGMRAEGILTFVRA